MENYEDNNANQEIERSYIPTITEEELLAEMKEIDPTFEPGLPLVRADFNNVIPIKPPTLKLEDYRSMNFTDLINETPPPLEYVLHPILPEQGIGWIYAATGMGKTLFTLNLAYAIAQGGEFLKYKSPKPKKVLYVDGEMSYSQLRERLMVIQKQQGELFYPDNFQVLTPDKILPFNMPKIDTPQGQEFYQTKLTSEGFQVVVFDNLSVLSSFDELKSNEWKPIQEWLLYLRALGITIIMVHHAGKDKYGYRGSSSFLDCADVAISLQPVSVDALEEELLKAKKLKVVYDKHRSFYGSDAFPFEVSFANDQWSYQSSERSELDRVIEMVGLEMIQIQIAKELNCSQSKVAKLIKKARALGLLSK